jgi:hypothetical protein
METNRSKSCLNTFESFRQNLRIFSFSENQIDGDTLLELNDNMIAQLFSIIKVQIRFHKSLNSLKNQIGLRSQQDLTEGMMMSDADCFYCLVSYVLFSVF